MVTSSENGRRQVSATITAPPFIGREAELTTIASLWEGALAGTPAIVFIEGEPGIGKSALLTRCTAGIEDAVIVRCGCEESERLVEYELLRQLLRAAGSGAGKGLAVLTPEISAEANPFAVGADLLGLLGWLQAAAPVVLVIDDLQLADALSAQALLFALRRLHYDQVMVLLGSRAGGIEELGERWARFAAGDDTATRIRLSGLDGGDRAIYDDLAPPRSFDLHERAAQATDGNVRLSHRMRAAASTDEDLARDLDAAGASARADRRLAEAASWYTAAATLSSQATDRTRRLLDAFECLIYQGDGGQAEAFVPRLAELETSPRLNGLLGHLDLVSGRNAAAEQRLASAWEQSDPATERDVRGAAAVLLASYLTLSGRLTEAVTWAERAMEAGSEDRDIRLHARLAAALAFTATGRGGEGDELLARFAGNAAEVPGDETDALAIRGMSRLFTDDVGGAVTDLKVAASRYRAGTRFRYDMQALTFLVDAEYRAGAWDDAALHSEFVVALAEDAERVRDLGFVHAVASLVPAGRGDWDGALSHIDAGWRSAEGSGIGAALTYLATARAQLETARRDPEAVLRVTDSARAIGSVKDFGRPGVFGWRALEAEALIDLGRFDEAGDAIGELEAATPSGLRSAEVAAARLRGLLLARSGDPARAYATFAAARRAALRLRIPFDKARLELAEAEWLNRAGRPHEALGCAKAARVRFATLRARPWVERCDVELEKAAETAGVPLPAPLPGAVADSHGLTPTEIVVARIVASGMSNRQVAAELFVSVKTIEVHLRRILDKLGIGSRRDVAGAIAPRPG